MSLIKVDWKLVEIGGSGTSQKTDDDDPKMNNKQLLSEMVKEIHWIWETGLRKYPNLAV